MISSPLRRELCPHHRRGFLQVGALGALGLALPDYLRQLQGAETKGKPTGETAGGKASSAILIFLGGGPSHHDTFDPKPDAPAEIRGQFDAISTNVAGIRVSSALPRLAKQINHLAILRAVTHRDAAHEPGVAFMNTGYSFRPGHNFPGIGAVVSFDRGTQWSNSLPAYVAMPDGRGGGYLGPAYHPFGIPGDPNSSQFRVQDVVPPEGFSDARLKRRRMLADEINAEFRDRRASELQAAADRFSAQAYSLMTSPQAQAAFDLARENAAARECYGRSQLGQRLLLARRLVEAGVPFVAATDFEWDDHQGIFPKLKDRLPVLDQAVSALVADLDERDLLDRTLVIVMGEFGRTPKINAMRGRDHWPNAFSVVLAGGGVRGGQTIGASDQEGAYPAARPVTPEELVHSIYELLGVEPTRFLPSTGGREIQIVRDGNFIQELTAG